MGYIPEEIHCDNLEAARVQPWQTFLLVSLVIFAAIPILLVSANLLLLLRKVIIIFLPIVE